MSTDKEKEKLHIFVNRRKFDENDGVKDPMNGAEIAALVSVPADIAVVRLQQGDNTEEVPVDKTIPIKNGMHFLVTRKTVEGGHE